MVAAQETDSPKLPEGASDRIRLWRHEPETMVRDLFKVEPEQWQLEGLRAFAKREKPRIAFAASKGPGKTAALSWLGWNFLLCYAQKGYHPKGAATAINKPNLDANLWTEFAHWRNQSPLLQKAFEWTKTTIFAREHPGTWKLEARSWKPDADRTQQADTLAGLHARFVLFLIDESGGIPDAVLAAADAALGTIDTIAWVVQAGNCTHVEGPLYRACTTERKYWHVIRINGDPDNPARSRRVSIEWAREQIERYGRDNPWVKVNVLGEFPDSSLNALLSVKDVESAMQREPMPQEYRHAQKRLGIDVARFGDDRTVIFPRQGLKTHSPAEMRQASSDEIAARVAKMKRDWGSELELLDDTGGWAHGAIDQLRLMRADVSGVQFHGKPIDARYHNRRAEMWMEMAEWVKRGGSLPKHCGDLVGELTVPTYTFKQGKFLLEDKQQVKERLGRSPDLADALALTFALPEMPAGGRDLMGQEHAIEYAGQPVPDPPKLHTNPFRRGR